MMAYSIRTAIESELFDSVICVTDSAIYADVARHYGAEVPLLRPAKISDDKSSDIEWVLWILGLLREQDREYEIFSILRPTSPFRQSDTIRNALNIFKKHPTADSIRAVQKCRQHPGKMWVMRSEKLLPLLPYVIGSTPWHSCQNSALPEIYVQDASLEIAWTRVPLECGSIAGEIIIPFFCPDREGFDINILEDWFLAEHFIKNGQATLPEISLPHYEMSNTRGQNG